MNTDRILSARILTLPPLARYGVAIAAGAAAVVLRLFLDPIWGVQLPFITLFPAIMLSAWLGGLGPGLLTTAITGVAAEYYWIEPTHSFAVADKSELVALVVFVVVGAVISALNEAWRRGTSKVALSEERLRVTLTSIGDGVIATDDRGRVTRLNAIAERLTGWRESEALGRTFDEVLVLVNEETRTPAANPVARVLREGVVTGLANHTLLIARDGREVPIDDSAAPVRDEAGHLLGTVMVFRDITERRQTERERVARERMAQELAAIVESSDDAIVGKDLNGVITAWNGAAERMYGYPAHEAIGQSIRLIVPEDRWREEDEILERINRGERLKPFETLRRCKDGRTVAISLTVSPIRDANGALVGASKTARDISARQQAEEARAAMLEREHAARVELERASHLKDEFLAVLSHELRTPLNAVLGYANLLATGSLRPDRTAHALDAIQRNAQAQSRLIESLLDLSRIIAGKLELDLKRTDARKLVESAVDVVRPNADGKRIALVVEGPLVEVPLVGDDGRLQQVLWNLLSNAVKFTPAGGEVHVRLTNSDSDVRIEVSDTGQGIKNDFLPYVFDRFKQRDGRSERSLTGLGLGLALVREMVQAHGGTVLAESAGEDRGSTFTVTLPSRPQLSMSSDAPESDDDTPDLRDLDVLVVDDDGDMRDLVAILLGSRGAAVRTVSSAVDALEAISHHRPDVMLADLLMPVEDGYSLIRTLRAREKTEHLVPLPAIAVTAYASPADRERALKAGYDSHLTKPFDAEALIRTIAKFGDTQNA